MRIFQNPNISTSTRTIPVKESTSLILRFLNSVIPHKNWFIAGGYVSYPKFARDVDIFFHSESDYLAAHHAFLIWNPSSIELELQTSNAATFSVARSILNTSYPFQLVCRDYGTPDQIFETFDLNRSKRAILPNGTTKFHPTSSDTLAITNLHYITFSRFLKYFDREIESYSPNHIESTFNSLIDQYISDTTVISTYHDNSGNITIPTNESLVKMVNSLSYTYNILRLHPTVLENIQQHLNRKLIEHAPELLL